MSIPQNQAPDQTPDVDPGRELLAFLVGRAEASPAEREAALALLDQVYPPPVTEQDTPAAPAGYRLVPETETFGTETDPEGGSQ